MRQTGLKSGIQWHRPYRNLQRRGWRLAAGILLALTAAFFHRSVQTQGEGPSSVTEPAGDTPVPEATPAPSAPTPSGRRTMLV